MLLILKKLAISISVVAIVASVGYEISQPTTKRNAIHLVSSKVMTHSMNVRSRDLKASKNPKGDGVFVYTKKRDGRGIVRKALWLVFEKEIFPLNTTAKELTPELKYPEEVMPTDWQMTGLNLYSFHKPMQWIFG